jgi:hypothetical protein
VDGTNFRRILLRASTSQYIPFSKRGRKDTPVKNDAPIDNMRLEDAERNRQCFLILIGALENGEIFLSCFHDSQPIPFNNKQPTSTGGLKRPGLVRPLKRF